MRRSGGWGDDGVELMLVQERVDAVVARPFQAPGARVEISLLGERTFAFGFDQDFLAEERQLAVAVQIVEFDQFLERLDRGAGTERSEVGIQAGFELAEHHQVFGIAETLARWEAGRIDQQGAFTPQRLQRGFHHPIHARMPTEKISRHADAGAAQRHCIQKPGVIRLGLAGRGFGRGITRIDAGHRAQQRGRVRHGACDRPSGVLTRRNRDYSRTADQADGGLQADDTAIRGWRNDRTVRLRPDGDSA